MIWPTLIAHVKNMNVMYLYKVNLLIFNKSVEVILIKASFYILENIDINSFRYKGIIFQRYFQFHWNCTFIQILY